MKKISIVFLTLTILFFSISFDNKLEVYSNKVYANCYTNEVYTNSYSNEVYASSTLDLEESKNYVAEILQIGSKRVAGSNEEKQVANYLQNKLENFGFSPFYTNYESVFEYKTEGKEFYSQNVIAIKRAFSNKYVIVGAHYDCVDGSDNNGVADNLGGIVSVLKFAKQHNFDDNNYNLIIAFYGAEEVGCCGSRSFVDGLSSSIKNNIILSITLDNVGAGDYNYFCSSDLKTDYGEYISNFAKEHSEFEEMKSSKFFSTSSIFSHSYSNLLLSSDASSYLTAGINSLLLFSGNLEQSHFVFKESNSKKISHNNDNLITVTDIFGDKYYNNIVYVSQFVDNLLNNENFSNIQSNQVATNIYNIYLVKLTGICVLFCIVVLGFSIYGILIVSKRLIKQQTKKSN